MIPQSSQPADRISWSFSVLLAFVVLATCLFSGCAGTGGGNYSSGTYHVNAYAATDPSKVHVFVSLRAKMVYVMEGDRALLVTPTSIGTPGNATPTGHFTVTAKDPTKRSGEYGFWTNGSDTYSGSSGAGRSGYHYVGYPMANWVEFAPGYGFHEGYVWPIARSHGCLRIHKNASVKFFEAGPHRHAGHDRRIACLTTTRSVAQCRCTRPTTRIPIRLRPS